MATQDDIDAIDAILNRGIEEVTDQDGRRHKYNFEELRKQRSVLVRSLRGTVRVRAGIYNPAFGPSSQ